MAAQQCPHCGRFLRNSLVDDLRGTNRPCPGCGEPLAAVMFGVTPDARPPTGDASVRPPDLSPSEVREDADVLAGWDLGADAAEIASWNHDRPPFPTDAVVVTAGGVIGAVVGGTLRAGRGRGAAIGALAIGGGLGVVTAAAARRIWRLDV